MNAKVVNKAVALFSSPLNYPVDGTFTESDRRVLDYKPSHRSVEQVDAIVVKARVRSLESETTSSVVSASTERDRQDEVSFVTQPEQETQQRMMRHDMAEQAQRQEQKSKETSLITDRQAMTSDINEENRMPLGISIVSVVPVFKLYSNYFFQVGNLYYLYPQPI